MYVNTLKAITRFPLHNSSISHLRWATWVWMKLGKVKKHIINSVLETFIDIEFYLLKLFGVEHIK